MEMYLIKSAACLAILLAFYKIFLETESMHTIKRFYLLLAVLASFGIPLLTFTYYIEAASSSSSAQVIEAILNPITQTTLATNGINWSAIMWTIYGLGALFFGIRFLLNLSKIIHKVLHNPKLKQRDFINVLLNSHVVPHTFFNYIFLNRSKFEKQEIPEEVLLHEQTHASQKHSIDILLIEILQVVFWFNPLIYLMKHSIKLNHEFLADQAVINHGVSLTTYQQLLLAFSSNAKEPQLANAINYSLIKKRFTVMKTKTSKNNVWIKSLVLLPLLAILIFSFSDKIPIDKPETVIDPIAQQKSASREEMAEYTKLAIHYNTMLKKSNDIVIKMKHVERMKYIYGIMSDKQRKDAESFPDFPKPPPPIAPILIEVIEMEAPISPSPTTKVPVVIELIEIEEPMSPPPPPIPANATPAQRAKYKAAIAKYAKKHPKSLTIVEKVDGELIELMEVPPPPPPEPVKHMKQMAKEGATFYYEGKKINSNEAIKIVQTNDGINIQIQDHISEKPIVKLSTKPIKLKKN